MAHLTRKAHSYYDHGVPMIHISGHELTSYYDMLEVKLDSMRDLYTARKTRTVIPVSAWTHWWEK